MLTKKRKRAINIYIKCHSRLPQLDRCIQSIKKYVSGFENIVLLNDGIGDPYLEKIIQKHPDVEVRNSEKISRNFISAPLSKSLQNENKDTDISMDPSKFWVNEVAKDVNRHFLLIEEDCCLNCPLDLNQIKNIEGCSGIFLVKMFFNVNARPDNSRAEISIQISELRHDQIEIYGKDNRIYSVANSIFQKDFWLYSYSNLRGWADEHKARRHVCEFLIECKNRDIPIRVGQSNIQIINQSNSSTVRKDSGGPAIVEKINAQLYNEALNKLWFLDKFWSMENFPSDYSTDYFCRL